MNGKGSKRRPKRISDAEFADRWERIFGNKQKSTRREHLHAPQTIPSILLGALLLLSGCLQPRPNAGVEASMQFRASMEALRGEYGPARGAWDTYRGLTRGK